MNGSQSDAELARRGEDRIGSTLKSKWHIDELLGVGGMASVYAATHRNAKRVAVKVLHPELSMNAAIRQRFLREGYVANSVGHPGAVSVDDDDITEDGCAFLVMELLDGETLETRRERKGQLEAAEVLALMDPVLDTLAAAHEKGIVHRDLKPENLFLTHSGQVKVLDFGIARVRELSAAGSSTQTGSTMGTPAFMPPEQARGRWDEVDPRSDLWAVGATMFALLTGRLVHVALTVNETLVLAVTERAPSVGGFSVRIPEEVVDLVDRALAYEKDARWASAREMQDALRQAYGAVSSKPISYVEAFEDDIPARTGHAVSSARGQTALGGVVATSSSIHPAASSSRTPLVIAAFAVASLVSVGAVLSRRGSNNEGARVSSTQSSAALSAVAAVSASVSAPIAPPLPAPPVFPIEKLPVAPREAATIAQPEPARHRDEATSKAALQSTSALPQRPSAAPTPPSLDPFAARH